MPEGKETSGNPDWPKRDPPGKLQSLQFVMPLILRMDFKPVLDAVSAPVCTMRRASAAATHSRQHLDHATKPAPQQPCRKA